MVWSAVEPVFRSCDAASIYCVLGVGVHCHPQSVVRLKYCYLSQGTGNDSVIVFLYVKKDIGQPGNTMLEFGGAVEVNLDTTPQ